MRARLRWLALGALGLSLAGAALLAARRRAPTLEACLRGARLAEARLALPAASAWVEGPPQAGAARVPLATLSALEAQGDAHALGVAHLARGDKEAARAALLRAGPGPDAQCDLAAVELELGSTEAALARLDALLEAVPRHPAALWNRALALERLGLRLGAAEAYEVVAGASEPGWGPAAAARATALRQGVQAEIDAWNALQTQGEAMVLGGPLPAPAEVQARPGAARLMFYAALAGAPSAEQARRLRPLAQTLDALTPTQALQQDLERVAARDFARRAPLAEAYRQLRTGLVDGKGPGASPEAQQRLREQLLAGGEPDLALAALTLLGDTSGPAEAVAPASAAWPDPWYAALAALTQAMAEAHEQVDYPTAELHLREALARCPAQGLSYLCLQLQLGLVQLLGHTFRLPAAEAEARAALLQTRALHEYPTEDNLLELLGMTYMMERSGSLARAHLREALLRNPKDCQLSSEIHLMLARLKAGGEPADYDGAVAEAAQAQDCAEGTWLLTALTYAEAYRHRPDPALAQRTRALLASSQGKRRPEQEPMALYLEGLLQIADSAEQGRAQMQRALAAAAQLPAGSEDARMVSSYARLELALAAAAEHQPAEVVRQLADELGVAPPGRCALALAFDSGRALGAALGPAGAGVAWLDPAAPRLPDPLPGPLLQALEGCPSVDVLARAPLHGQAGLLPDGWAWRHRAGQRPQGTGAGPAPAPRRLVVRAPEPPASLGLPRLAQWSSVAELRDERSLSGAEATPARVLAELEEATEVEIHAHGFVDLSQAEATLLALSPEPSGRYALSVPMIRARTLKGHPVVVLAACQSAQPGSAEHRAWSLPAAFIEAGARAVLASRAEVPDREAPRFFGAVLRRIRAGAEPAVALRDERVEWLKQDPESWVKSVVLFQ